MGEVKARRRSRDWGREHPTMFAVDDPPCMVPDQVVHLGVAIHVRAPRTWSLDTARTSMRAGMPADYGKP